MQTALSGAVTRNLRAVIVTWTDTEIHFDAYYDEGITEIERELMSLAETDLIAGFWPGHEVTYNSIRLDHPAPIPKTPHWVYHRYEGENWGQAMTAEKLAQELEL